MTIQNAPDDAGPPPIAIAAQGAFAIGGVVLQQPGTAAPNDPARPKAGQTFHADHAHVTYQVAARSRALPIVMWHGEGHFSRIWDTTPDGREGFRTLFLRQGFAVYLVEQPRTGNAGNASVSAVFQPDFAEQQLFHACRLGVWPRLFDGVEFRGDDAALNQFFRRQTPSIGPADTELNAGVACALFDRIGDGILMTHGAAAGSAWRAACANRHIRALIAYEPGCDLPFPEGHLPKALDGAAERPVEVAEAVFQALTQIPVAIFFGDNLALGPRIGPLRLETARMWCALVNERGGNAALVHLPEAGIAGNTHLPFCDTNNREVADLAFAFLDRNGLDSYA